MANIASTKNKVYSYADVNDCNTNNRYYRLMITNNAGSIEYSPVIRVGSSTKNIIAVYPNPATNGNLQLQTTFTGLSTIQLFDANGKLQLLLNKNVQGISTIDISKLPKGNYFLQINHGLERLSKIIVVQ